MVMIVCWLVCTLFFGGAIFVISKSKVKGFLCFLACFLVMALWMGIGPFIDKTIQAEETLIGTYQLESVEKVEDAYYLIKPENGKKEYIEAENVEPIEDLTCTHPYMQVYQVTQKSSLSPIILGIIFLEPQYGSSTTMRYEITIPPNTVQYIQKTSY